MRLGALRHCGIIGGELWANFIEIDRMRLGALRPFSTSSDFTLEGIIIEIDRMRLGVLRRVATNRKWNNADGLK